MRVAVALFFCFFISENVWADDYSAVINDIETERVADQYVVNGDIAYKLSPVVKEALKKGISISLTITMRLKKEGLLWDSVVRELKLAYQIQNHALLNIYSVKSLHADEKNVFSTLAGAIDYISRIRDLPIVESSLVQEGQQYYIAAKVSFEHEKLPVPIRPFSYFDSQWALSSDWTLWPLPN